MRLLPHLHLQTPSVWHFDSHFLLDAVIKCLMSYWLTCVLEARTMEAGHRFMQVP
jgi:hypothetical protein